jgi:hypothetical protein
MLPENGANLQKAESNYAQGKIFRKGFAESLASFQNLALNFCLP